jgi:hypothetical protein
MNIYIIVTVEQLKDGNTDICYRKQMFFSQAAAFEAAKPFGNESIVMRFEFQESWNAEQRKAEEGE